MNYKHLSELKMEAIAKHDFNATADDELSFKKHQGGDSAFGVFFC